MDEMVSALGQLWLLSKLLPVSVSSTGTGIWSAFAVSIQRKHDM